MLSGLPVSVDISSDVIYSAVVDPLHSIMDSIKVILERTPPELAADIIKMVFMYPAEHPISEIWRSLSIRKQTLP